MAAKRKTPAPKKVSREPAAPRRARAGTRKEARPSEPPDTLPGNPAPGAPEPLIAAVGKTQIGVEDLIIRARGSTQLFWVKKSEYTDVSRRLPDQLAGMVDLMADQGAVVADVPPDLPGVGAACILLNIDRIKPSLPADHGKLLDRAVKILGSRK